MAGKRALVVGGLALGAREKHQVRSEWQVRVSILTISDVFVLDKVEMTAGSNKLPIVSIYATRFVYLCDLVML